ncbi:MAG: 6-hydroxymethylpterin diphosphokinase MptE-like protein [Acidobacteriota bacterium]
MLNVSEENGWTTAVLDGHAGPVSLHSRRDPVGEADRVAAPVVAHEARHLVVIGLGLGYLLDALDRRGWNGTVLAFEPLPDTVTALRNRAVTARWLDEGRLHLFVAPDFRGADEAWRALDDRGDPPPVLVHPVLLRERPALVAAARERLGRVLFDARANAEARRKQSGSYLRNTLLNAARLAEAAPSDALDGLFSDMPAVLVGAGPSLDAALESLRALGQRALVIAVDTATRPLLAAGISPDLVVALDPTDVNARHLVDLPAYDSWLVAEGSVDPHAVAAFAPRLFAFAVGPHHPWPWLDRLGVRPGRLRAWGSVLTAATDLALRAGCPRLVFIGADLAFTGRRPYCRGTAFEADWAREVARGRSLDEVWGAAVDAWPEAVEPDTAGLPARTAPHLVAFRDWLVRQSVEHADRLWINASGAGILHGGTVRVSALADALAGCADRRATTRRRLADAHAAARHARRGTVLQALSQMMDAARSHADDPRAGWLAFAQPTLGAEALADTLAAASSAVVARRPSRDPAVALARAAGVDPAAIGDRDLDLLRRWGRPPDRLVALPAASPDRSVMVDRVVAALTGDELVVLLDADTPDGGTAVRRQLARLASHQGTLWYDDGLFHHWESRLFAVSCAPGFVAEAPLEADKYGADHQAIARDVVQDLAHWIAGASVVDVGCGEGHWIRAAREAGATRAVGVRLDRSLPAPAPDVAAAVTGRDVLRAHRADTALLLHVADRLPPAEADALIADVCQAADLVVFASVPPACGRHSPRHARPFAAWARAFAAQGFALDDDGRGRFEERQGLAPSWYHAWSAFKRVWPRTATGAPPRDIVDALMALAARADDAWQHGVRLRVRSLARDVRPSGRIFTVDVPPHHLLTDEHGGCRVQLPSTIAATSTVLEVWEGDRQLRRTSVDGVAGTWRLVDAELRFWSTDGVLPRFSGRRYTLRLLDEGAWSAG